MSYIVNTSLFIRKEIQNEETVYLVYVGDRDDMYKLNEASFDCFTMLENNLTFDEICDALCHKYFETSRDAIEDHLRELLMEFISAGIIAQEK